MMTHHSVMTSSLCIKNKKITNFVIFRMISIIYNSKTDVFRDIFYHMIYQCRPRCTKGTSSGHKVSTSFTAQVSETRLYIYTIYI